MSDATSVGKVQLDVEINQSSLNAELNKIGKVFNSGINNSFKGMFSGMANQMNSFVKDSITKMTSGFKNFSQSGAEANKQVAQSTEDISLKIQQLVNQMESATNRAELHRQKLLELQSQYDRLSKAGLGDSEKAKKLLEKITLAEDKVNRYGAISDRTRIKIEQLEQSMSNLGDKGFRKVDDGAKKANRSFKLFGDQADKSARKINTFSNTLTRSFMQVLKRVFVLNLIYKAIRGLMNYMNSSLKTNKEFTNSLNQIGTNLRVAFQPIYDFILPGLNSLMQAVAKATAYIAAAISALFGKTYQQSFGAAKGIENAKKAMTGYGGASKKAAKDAKGALASFDEINQLDIADDESDSGGVGGFEMEMPDTSTIDLSGMDAFVEKLKTMFQPTIDALIRFKEVLEPLKSFVAQGLYDFYNNFLVPVGQWTLGEGLPRFIDAITKGLLGISWDTINASLNNLWIALTPFAINVGEGLLWFWENVLVPLGTWVMNEVVPVFLDILSEAIRVLNSVIEALKPLGSWLWDSFLQPLAEWTGGVIVGVLDGIKVALEGIGDWISNNQKTVENMAIAIGSFMTAWLIVDLAVKIGGIVTALITFITTGGLATTITTVFGAAVAFLTSPITIAVAVIGTLIAVGILLYKNWDEVSAWLKKIWEGIKISATNIFNNIKETISNVFNSVKTNVSNIWNGITTGLKNAFDSIYNSAFNIFNKMKDFIKGITDNIGGFFKGMVNGIIKALNSMINGLNKLKVNIPNWVPGIGGESLGFSIPNIPYLAKGGIVSQPTLAMVGEYSGARSNPEIVSPQSMMHDTVASATAGGFVAIVEAIQRLERTLREKNMTAVIGKDDIGKTAIDFIREQTIMNGESPIPI